MDSCSKCGVARRYVGVAFPVRRLCKCENRDCGECKKPAVYVEFQHPIKTGEPKLPIESNQYAKFACQKHAPDDLPEGGDEVPSTPAGKKGKRPHTDPVWDRASSRPPPGSLSKTKIVCSGCGLVHEPRLRVMWNGTYSECPVDTCREQLFQEQ